MNMARIKQVFEEMTRIDSDPKSERAQQYYQTLEDQERTNRKKRAGQIIVKTFRRSGKYEVDKIEIGPDG